MAIVMDGQVVGKRERKNSKGETYDIYDILTRSGRGDASCKPVQDYERLLRAQDGDRVAVEVYVSAYVTKQGAAAINYNLQNVLPVAGTGPRAVETASKPASTRVAV